MRWLAFLIAAVSWAQPNPRVGFYQWDTDPKASPAQDYLTTARERIHASGAGLLRFYLGARFDYAHPVLSCERFPGLRDRVPARILQLPRYRSAIADPLLPTLVLTVYPSLDYGAGPDDISLLRPWGAREESAEYGQMLDLACLLLREYGSLPKTVILANSEADSRMLEIMDYTGSPALAIRNLIAWQNARYRAVEDARKRYPHTRLRLLNAFEVSLIHLKLARDGVRFVKRADGEWNALEDVVPKVRFDLLSYSAYESINAPYDTLNVDTPPEQVGARLKRDLGLLRQSVHRPVMVGELGFAREIFDRLKSGGADARMASALNALEQAQPRFVVFWQAMDAPSRAGEPVELGLLDPRRRTPEAVLRFIARFGRP